MAFISMIFAALAIVAAIMGFIGFIGFVLIIIALITRSRAKKAGRTPKKGLLVTGIVIFSIPLAIILVILAIIAVSNIKLNIERAGYTSFTDKWKNEWVADNQAEQQVVDRMLLAAKNDDAAALADMFTDEIKADPLLMRQAENFIAEFPDEIIDLEYDDRGGGAGGSGKYEDFSASGIFTDGERYYYLHMYAVTANDDNPEDIGVKNLEIYSDVNKALEGKGMLSSDGKYITAYITPRTSENCCIVNERPYIYTPHDRVITKEQMESAIKNARGLKDLEAAVGEPDGVAEEYSEVLYLISSDEGYRYCVVDYDYYKRVSYGFMYGEQGSGLSSHYVESNKN